MNSTELKKELLEKSRSSAGLMLSTAAEEPPLLSLASDSSERASADAIELFAALCPHCKASVFFTLKDAALIRAAIKRICTLLEVGF